MKNKTVELNGLVHIEVRKRLKALIKEHKLLPKGISWRTIEYQVREELSKEYKQNKL